MKKIRIVSEKQVKKAYAKNKVSNRMNSKEEVLKKELGIETVDKLPEEVFSLLGETLLFIDNIDKIEEEKNANK